MYQDITEPIALAYIDRMERLGRSYLTIKLHRQTARRFQEYLSAIRTTATKIEPWQMDEFFHSMQDILPSSRHGHLRRVRSWYRYAMRRGVVQIDPTHDVEIPRPPDEEPVIIPNETLRRYKRELRTDQQWAQFHLLTFAGLRRMEAIMLQWEDVNLPEQTLTVRRGKGGKLRHVPIHPQLAEALMDLKGERAGPVIRPARKAKNIGADTWSKIMQEYAGREHTAHDFRRTVASSLALNGVSDALIDKIMGWAPRAVGRRYYIRVAEPELHRAILKLYADDPI